MEKIRIKDLNSISKEQLKGKIIVFPTDTVYGVGAFYNDIEGIEKIYEMKKRDYGKLLPVLCSSIDQIKEIAETNELFEKYSKLWPGALTMILNKNDSTSESSNIKTIALRIPNSKIALSVLDYFGPMNVTSVNYSGEKELNSPEEIEKCFGEYIDYLVMDTNELCAIPSTIIDCTGETVKVLRQGIINIK